ncbi:MAG: hypothetical protein OXC18_15155 [Desulfurellaceae bacterium]|nr:hypothetical protein [Desulfurellaceae bacterium]
MTDTEVDAGIGRLATRYSAVNRKIACLKGTLQEAAKPAYEAAILLRCGSGVTALRLQDHWAKLNPHDIIATIQDLVASEEEKAQIEDRLREAGLDNLIRS